MREVILQNVKWYDEDPTDDGIYKSAIESIDYEYCVREVQVGYNDILLGDYVIKDGERMRVVMVSRLGDFGLSSTGDLPYTIRVFPNEVTKII